MSLVLVESGMRDLLDMLGSAWNDTRFVGLMQNVEEPTRNWTIGTVQPADFSGYVGLRPTQGWKPATMLGDRAVSSAAYVEWTHDGGPIPNWIFGYYCVNSSGTLLWAERRPGPGFNFYAADQVYRIVPQFSIGSRFPTEEDP